MIEMRLVGAYVQFCWENRKVYEIDSIRLEVVYMEVSKSDWKLFRTRIAEWQEAYMERLVKEIWFSFA